MGFPPPRARRCHESFGYMKCSSATFQASPGLSFLRSMTGPAALTLLEAGTARGETAGHLAARGTAWWDLMPFAANE